MPCLCATDGADRVAPQGATKGAWLAPRRDAAESARYEVSRVAVLRELEVYHGVCVQWVRASQRRR